jgi:hypothetical protein
LICLSAETASIRVAAIVGVNVLITSGEETGFRENAYSGESLLRFIAYPHNVCVIDFSSKITCSWNVCECIVRHYSFLIGWEPVRQDGGS